MAMLHGLPYIPMMGNNHQRMRYIQIIDNDSYQTVDRDTFFTLLHTADRPDERVVLDLDAAMVYFAPPSAGMATVAVEFAREADRQKKQYKRRHSCAYYGTVKCDGWRKSADGHRVCESCTRIRTMKTISLDALVADTQAFASNTPIDQVLDDEYNREILHLTLATLSPGDRQFILDRYRDGMNFSQLAEKYGMKDRHYASKKAGRIIQRLRQAVEKIEKVSDPTVHKSHLPSQG